MSGAADLADNDAWLSQGDVFRSVPIASVGLREDRGLHLTQSAGPAVLMTHDCAIDKRNKSNGLTIERICFLPVLTTDGLESARRSTLRASQGKDQPYEVMYLGDLSEFGECFLTISNPKVLPASYFKLALTDLGGGDLRATPTDGDTRSGRLRDGDTVLLRRKWNAYWTRTLPE